MNNRVAHRVLNLAEPGQGRVASSRVQVVASSERAAVGDILFKGWFLQNWGVLSRQERVVFSFSGSG